MALLAAFSPRRLQFRIVALFLGLLLAVQLASMLLIGSGIGANARAAVNAELRTGERVFARVLQQNAANLDEAARLLAADNGFRDAAARHDNAALTAALRRQSERIGAALALFADPHLNVLASTGEADARITPALYQAASSIRGGPQLVLIDGQPVQWVTVPVRTNALIGWVAMGLRLEEPLLREMRQLSSIEVALLTQGGTPRQWRLATSTLDRDGSQAFTAQWQARRHGDGSATLAERGLLLSLAVPGHGAGTTGDVLAREMLLGRDGEQAVVAVLMRSLDEATVPYRRLQWLLFAFTLVAVAVFAIGSVLTARRIATPLLALTRSARRLGQGDYSAPLEVRGGDEIGDLAQAFEAMRQAVREREAEVHRLAYEDTLTKLPNRERFRTDLRAALTSERGQPRPCAVLMLDLDRFKNVNDVLGHRFGDRLLLEVALRLAQQARPGRDLVARLGGDEFALLLAGSDAAAAQEVARRILHGFEAPIALDKHRVDLSAGIGIACSPEHGSDADLLMSHAEVAMYAAKRRQLGVVVYGPALDSGSEAALSLVSELRVAVEQQQLRLYLQPKISLATGEVLGAEALMRWQHPERGLQSPLSFIPFAEQTGFIRELTGWLLERSAELLSGWRDAGTPMKLAINLSTRDLLDPALPATLAGLAERHGFEPAWLCLEITESAIMDDPQRALQTLERLHATGFKLAIDDFGTGYSSLAYLKRLPVDELKIDQSFVLNMERDLDDAKIVRSTVDLAHNLGLTVVAEGVETAKAWKLLQSLGCDEAQGYFVARPMPQALFAAWAADWAAPPMQSVRLDTAFATL